VLDNLKPPEKGQKRIRDDLLPGFGVTVGKRTKTFFVMYGNKERRIKTFGRYPDKKLKDAREEARQFLERVGDKKPVRSVSELSEAFLADCETRLKPNSIHAYESVLKHAPDILLEEANKETIELKTAHEIKTYKAMFNWAIREEITDRNPFFHMKVVFGKRDRVLSYDEIEMVWAYDSPPYSDIVKLLLLSGQRVGQFGNFSMDWFEDRKIIFPAEVMKGGKPHEIPTTPLIRKYLDNFKQDNWDRYKKRMDKSTGVTHWVLHDLRRTFATIHAEIGTPIHVVEALLNHTSGTISGVTAIYIRYQFFSEMRKALLLYERHLTKTLGLRKKLNLQKQTTLLCTR
jgi:integrase